MLPNHCRNKLTLIGPDVDVQHFVDRADAPGQVWHENLKRYQAEHTHEKIEGAIDVTAPDDVVESIAESHRSVLQFSAFVPIPNYEPGADYDQIGYKGERDAWGCKWGAYSERIVENVLMSSSKRRVTYEFQTAWNPPHKFLEKVSAMYPNIVFLLSYAEENPTRGRWMIQDGVIDTLIDDRDSPDFHDKDAPEYIEDEDDRGAAWEKWEAEYYDSHDEWISDAAFMVTLEKALGSATGTWWLDPHEKA
jgi:hypothetical protein